MRRLSNHIGLQQDSDETDAGSLFLQRVLIVTGVTVATVLALLLVWLRASRNQQRADSSSKIFCRSRLMKVIQPATIVLILALVLSGLPVQAQQQALRATDAQVRQLFERLDEHAESFHRHFSEAIARSFLHDAEIGDYFRRFVAEFDHLAARLKERARKRQPVSTDVPELLNRAARIDTFMRSYDLGLQAERDWQVLRADLNQLARFYTITTRWDLPTAPGINLNINTDVLPNRLIGTYRLDRSQSEDVRRMVEGAVNILPRAEQRRRMSALIRQLRAPELIAIDRQGSTVTFVSSLQPPRTYRADGRAQNEQTSDGRDERVTTLLYGDQFRMETNNQNGEYYSVTFDSTGQGDRLHVTRTLLADWLVRPIVVTSFYRKISDAPQLNIFAEKPGRIAR